MFSRAQPCAYVRTSRPISAHVGVLFSAGAGRPSTHAHEPDRGNGQLPGQAAGAELGWGWRSDRSGPLGLEASGNLAFAAAVASADFVHPGRFMELGRVFRRFVEVGRVAYVSFGPHAGKLVAIVDVIDQNRKYVRQAWEKADINAKWAATRWAKKIEAREKKAKMTDFDRYKVMKARKMLCRFLLFQTGQCMKPGVIGHAPDSVVPDLVFQLERGGAPWGLDAWTAIRAEALRGVSAATTAMFPQGIGLQQGISCISLNCPCPSPHPTRLRLLSSTFREVSFCTFPVPYTVTEISGQLEMLASTAYRYSERACAWRRPAGLLSFAFTGFDSWPGLHLRFVLTQRAVCEAETPAMLQITWRPLFRSPDLFWSLSWSEGNGHGALIPGKLWAGRPLEESVRAVPDESPVPLFGPYSGASTGPTLCSGCGRAFTDLPTRRAHSCLWARVHAAAHIRNTSFSRPDSLSGDGCICVVGVLVLKVRRSQARALILTGVGLEVAPSRDSSTTFWLGFLFVLQGAYHVTFIYSAIKGPTTGNSLPSSKPPLSEVSRCPELLSREASLRAAYRAENQTL
ncbi:hypothetical protein CB1_001546007 [Camelus ferus]|nr:hypothetical protein CB1_001546007 [Camelus ferus]